ncbi:MAG: alpha-galactosidase [Clostridia bacterium]|nr:alpha-galactosidase [Clostridia bacterium]
MIREENSYFFVETESLSYIFRINNAGYPVHLYFGPKTEVPDLSALGLKEAFPKGTSTIVDEKEESFSADNSLLEYSFPEKGDYKAPALIIRNRKRGYTFDFRYDSFSISKECTPPDGLPELHDMDEELTVVLKDKELPIYLELHYLVSGAHDVIARNTVLVNKDDETLTIEKIASLQLDMINQNMNMLTLNGGWINETHKEVSKIVKGIHIIDSKTGNSSNRHNPFFMVAEENANDFYGLCYGFNLMYSGNHEELIELTTYDHLHIQTGINPHLFMWELNKDERFVTPYALLSVSYEGANRLSRNFHEFINSCVINENFRSCPRPVVINNWEGTYFRFTEKKLLDIAKTASRFGVEVFVMDDGWFSTRNDDRHGLGDYDVNRKKLPSGITGLAEKIEKLGMKFGIWMEPEGVNPDSKIYRAHPDWAIHTEGVKPSLGRNELLFDLTKKEVREYILSNISSILSSGKVSYVKWDMNRNMSDMPEPGFNHRYILGLYSILKELKKRFPDVLFENCASGGNRFDLGMLTFFPETWASDCSDPYERISIQEGLSYGYPQSTWTAHVSHSLNHQMLRYTPYRTKFDVAAFGVLGYELMLNELTPVEKKEVKKQIEFYKKHRMLLQYGEFVRLKRKDYPGDSSSWMVRSRDRTEAIVGFFNGLQTGNPKDTVLRNLGLDPDKTYRIEVLKEDHKITEFGNLINMISPVHLNSDGFLVETAAKYRMMDMEKEEYTVTGTVLNSGLILKSQWAGNGYSTDVRILGDFGARLYYIREIK